MPRKSVFWVRIDGVSVTELDPQLQAQDTNFSLSIGFDTCRVVNTNEVNCIENILSFDFGTTLYYETLHGKALATKLCKVQLCRSRPLLHWWRDSVVASVAIDLQTIATGPQWHELQLLDGGNAIGTLQMRIQMVHVEQLEVSLADVEVELPEWAHEYRLSLQVGMLHSSLYQRTEPTPEDRRVLQVASGELPEVAPGASMVRLPNILKVEAFLTMEELQCDKLQIVVLRRSVGLFSSPEAVLEGHITMQSLSSVRPSSAEVELLAFGGSAATRHPVGKATFRAVASGGPRFQQSVDGMHRRGCVEAGSYSVPAVELPAVAIIDAPAEGSSSGLAQYGEILGGDVAAAIGEEAADLADPPPPAPSLPLPAPWQWQWHPPDRTWRFRNSSTGDVVTSLPTAKLYDCDYHQPGTIGIMLEKGPNWPAVVRSINPGTQAAGHGVPAACQHQHHCLRAGHQLIALDNKGFNRLCLFSDVMQTIKAHTARPVRFSFRDPFAVDREFAQKARMTASGVDVGAEVVDMLARGAGVAAGGGGGAAGGGGGAAALAAAVVANSGASTASGESAGSGMAAEDGDHDLSTDDGQLDPPPAAAGEGEGCAASADAASEGAGGLPRISQELHRLEVSCAYMGPFSREGPRPGQAAERGWLARRQGAASATFYEHVETCTYYFSWPPVPQ